MIIDIALSARQEALIRHFAEQKNVTIGRFMLDTTLEKIEDELDARDAEKAYADYLADPITYSTEEVGIMLGIEQETAFTEED